MKLNEFFYMDKLIRDGRVGVVVDDSCGKGWFTNHGILELVFSPKIIEMIETKQTYKINSNWIKDTLGIDNIKCYSARTLIVQWIEVGTYFIITTKPNGKETIITINDLKLKA